MGVRRSAVETDIGRFAIVPLWITETDVSHLAVRLYVELAGRFANKDGQAWPSRKRLKEILGVGGLATVDRAIDELKRIGAVHVEPRFDPRGHHTSNLYVVKMVRPEEYRPRGLFVVREDRAEYDAG
jgi:helix-turn-helix protein